MDEVAAKKSKLPKIDQRGTLAFPALNKGKSGGGVVTNAAADGMLAKSPNEIKMAIGYCATSPSPAPARSAGSRRCRHCRSSSTSPPTLRR